MDPAARVRIPILSASEPPANVPIFPDSARASLPSPLTRPSPESADSTLLCVLTAYPAYLNRTTFIGFSICPPSHTPHNGNSQRAELRLTQRWSCSSSNASNPRGAETHMTGEEHLSLQRPGARPRMPTAVPPQRQQLRTRSSQSRHPFSATASTIPKPQFKNLICFGS